jgi:hypothetical protein
VKLCFKPSFVGEGATPGILREWEAFVERVAAHDGSADLVDSESRADVVVHCSDGPGIIRNARAVLRPLTRWDVEHITWDWGDRPSGRMSGLYCSLPTSQFDPRRHRTAPYPLPFNALVQAFPHEDAIYNFGFVGGITAALRVRLLDTLKPTEQRDRSFVSVNANDWRTTYVERDNELKRSYVSFLQQTKFILCPRGYGVGSARVFEAMQAGRVPVIISDRYVPPSGIDWAACSIRISETGLADIPRVISSRMADWPHLATNARLAWEANFSDEHVLDYVRRNIEDIHGSTPSLSRSLQLRHAYAVARASLEEYVRPAIGRFRSRFARGFRDLGRTRV